MQDHIAHLTNAASYKQVFAERFPGTSLGPAWRRGIWFESPAPVANYQVANGELTLKWKRGQQPPDTSISSIAHWRFGYFSIRMKWAAGVTGAWPAWWFLPIQAQTGAQETGELDGFEGEGISRKTYFGTVHSWMKQTELQSNSSSNYYSLPPDNDFSQYHLYGVLWTPTAITWFYDGVPLNTVTPYPIFAQQDYFMVIGSQVGAAWKMGNLNGVTANEMDVTVDSVGVWQLS